MAINGQLLNQVRGDGYRDKHSWDVGYRCRKVRLLEMEKRRE